MGIFKNIFGKPNTKVISSQALPDFDSLRELGQIVSIFPWIFNPNMEAANTAGRAIHQLLISHSTFKNKSTYHALRNVELKVNNLKRFYDFKPEVRNSLFSVASMNSNGYVRESALQYLIKSPTQNTFPFILFRLADWVPTIQITAERGVRSLIHQQSPTFLIRHHKNIDWLSRIERVNLQRVHQEVTKFIFSDSNFSQVIDNFHTYEEGDRYFVIKNLIDQKKLGEEIFIKAITDKNYLIRLLVIKHIDLAERPEILKRLLNDKSQKIRSFALNKIPELHLERFQPALSNLLLDSSASIRIKSRLLISKFSNLEFHELYLSATIHTPTPGSILGLSEVGSKSDIDTITTFFSSKSAKLRSAALIALANLDYDRAKQMAFYFMHDPSNTVKKTSVNLISKDRSPVDLSKLRSIYEEGNNETKKIVLKAMSKFGGWGIVGDLLRGMNEESKNINQTAYALLKSWYNYSIALATNQNTAEKAYVMGVYNQINFEKLNIPRDVKKIVDELPFIFGHNKKPL
jgi:hypothetical protein